MENIFLHLEWVLTCCIRCAYCMESPLCFRAILLDHCLLLSACVRYDNTIGSVCSCVVSGMQYLLYILIVWCLTTPRKSYVSMKTTTQQAVYWQKMRIPIFYEFARNMEEVQHSSHLSPQLWTCKVNQIVQWVFATPQYNETHWKLYIYAIKSTCKMTARAVFQDSPIQWISPPKIWYNAKEIPKNS